MPPNERAAPEKVGRIANEAIEHLIAELKAGRSETLRNYLATMSRFHRYSWTNTLLIHSQRPSATRVAGYHTWHQLGRTVKRGEKGMMIYAPLVTKAAEPEKSERVDQAPTSEGQRVTGYRAAYVFDVEQTVGRPLPALSATRGDPKDYTEKLKAIVAKQGIALEYDATIAPADGVSAGGKIRLRPDLPPAEEFSVLAHELAHEMLHHAPELTRVPQVVRETQAEAVAFVVSRGIGLETGTAAADYIALYNGDAKTLADSLATIQHASSKILESLLPEERLPAAPERSAATQRSEPLQGGKVRERSASTPEHPATGPDLSDSVSMDR